MDELSYQGVATQHKALRRIDFCNTLVDHREAHLSQRHNDQGRSFHGANEQNVQSLPTQSRSSESKIHSQSKYDKEVEEPKPQKIYDDKNNVIHKEDHLEEKDHPYEKVIIQKENNFHKESCLQEEGKNKENHIETKSFFHKEGRQNHINEIEESNPTIQPGNQIPREGPYPGRLSPL